MQVGKITALAMVGLLSTFASAYAEDAYPSRPVSLVVPNAPGGGMDIVARILGKKLSAALGQSIVVENRPGAAENIGIRSVAQAAPDGYTLLLSSNTITINPSLFSHLDYDANKDLQPIGKVASLPLLIVCGSSAPYKTLSELIAYAKANPNKLSYGSPGVGTPHNLAMELLKSNADINIQHIPYRGAAPALNDLLGGTIPLMPTTIPSVKAYLQSGKLRAVATMHPTRLSEFPDVPAVSETIPGYGVDIWLAVFAPAATAQQIVGNLTSALEGVVRDSELATQFNRLGVLASWTAPAELRTEIGKEQAQWAAIIKKAGIQAK
jgi:tripartite-type tricarboxylate transporter receptor subunit TctC